MKATELRIGNLVNLYDFPVKILNIETYCELGDNFTFKKKNGEVVKWSVSEIEGIQLTVEWLEKAGFELKSNLFQKNPDNRRVVAIIKNPKNDGYSLFYAFADETGKGYHTFLRKVNYVHELQNLWFSLTGEELTFSE